MNWRRLCRGWGHVGADQSVVIPQVWDGCYTIRWWLSIEKHNNHWNKYGWRQQWRQWMGQHPNKKGFHLDSNSSKTMDQKNIASICFVTKEQSVRFGMHAYICELQTIRWLIGNFLDCRGKNSSIGSLSEIGTYSALEQYFCTCVAWCWQCVLWVYCFSLVIVFSDIWFSVL